MAKFYVAFINVIRNFHYLKLFSLMWALPTETQNLSQMQSIYQVGTYFLVYIVFDAKPPP